MNDLRSLIERAAPSVRDVDLLNINRRAAHIALRRRARDTRRMTALAVVVVVVVSSVAGWAVLYRPADDAAVSDSPSSVLDDRSIPLLPLLLGGNAVGVPAADPIDLQGIDLAGNPVMLSDLVSGPALVHFSELGCANCDNQLQQLALAAEQLRGTAAVVVVVEPTDAAVPDMADVLRRHGLDDRVLVLPDTPEADAPLTDVLPGQGGIRPLTIALDERRVVRAAVGATGLPMLLLMVQRVMAGAPFPAAACPPSIAMPTPTDSGRGTVAPPPGAEQPSTVPSLVVLGTYVVQPDDTLRSIAQHVYGDPSGADAIAAASNLPPGAPIVQAGQELLIPQWRGACGEGQ